MPTTYSLPTPEEAAVLKSALDRWHEDLRKYEVVVQLLFAANDGDSPAVSHHGYPAIASVRVVSLKDRLTKNYDAEVVFDRKWWDSAPSERQLSACDHELSHLQVVMKKMKRPRGSKGPPSYELAVDDIGRPKLKLIKADANVGDAFAECIRRHGDDAIEYENARVFYAFAEDARKGTDDEEER